MDISDDVCAAITIIGVVVCELILILWGTI